MLNIALLKEVFQKRTFDFWLFESSVWFTIFASSLISLFIPILLYESGYSIKTIVAFYFVFHILATVLGFVVEKSIYKFGAKINVIIGIVFNIAFFITLEFLTQTPDNMVLLFTLAVLAAIFDAFYYIATNYIFIGSTKKQKNVKGNTTILNVVIGSAAFLGPLTGSILILLNESLLIYVVIVFFMISVVPLLKLSHIKTKPDHKAVPLKQFFKMRKEKMNFFLLGLYKIIQGVNAFLWPLFLFLFFKGNIEAVAFLAVLIPVSGMVYNLISGSINEKKFLNILTFTMFLLVLSWIVRLVTVNYIALYLSAIVISLSLLFLQLGVDSNIYSRAKKAGPLVTSTQKNSIAMLFKALMFGALLLVAEQNILEVSFYIALATSFVLFLLSFKKECFKELCR